MKSVTNFYEISPYYYVSLMPEFLFIPKIVRTHTPIGCIGLLVLLLFALSGCTLGQAEATPVPFAVTPYAQDAPQSPAEETGSTGAGEEAQAWRQDQVSARPPAH